MDFEIFSLEKVPRRPLRSASSEFDKDSVGPDDVDCLHKTTPYAKIEPQIWTTGQLPKIRVLGQSTELFSAFRYKIPNKEQKNRL